MEWESWESTIHISLCHLAFPHPSLPPLFPIQFNPAECGDEWKRTVSCFGGEFLHFRVLYHSQPPPCSFLCRQVIYSVFLPLLFFRSWPFLIILSINNIITRMYWSTHIDILSSLFLVPTSARHHRVLRPLQPRVASLRVDYHSESLLILFQCDMLSVLPAHCNAVPHEADST